MTVFPRVHQDVSAASRGPGGRVGSPWRILAPRNSLMDLGDGAKSRVDGDGESIRYTRVEREGVLWLSATGVTSDARPPARTGEVSESDGEVARSPSGTSRPGPSVSGSVGAPPAPL